MCINKHQALNGVRHVYARVCLCVSVCVLNCFNIYVYVERCSGVVVSYLLLCCWYIHPCIRFSYVCVCVCVCVCVERCSRVVVSYLLPCCCYIYPYLRFSYIYIYIYIYIYVYIHTCMSNSVRMLS